MSNARLTVHGTDGFDAEQIEDVRRFTLETEAGSFAVAVTRSGGLEITAGKPLRIMPYNANRIEVAIEE